MNKINHFLKNLMRAKLLIIVHQKNSNKIQIPNKSIVIIMMKAIYLI